MWCSSKKNTGFTLIEVVIGFTIGTLLIGAVYTYVLSTIKNTIKNERKQTASLSTQDILESLKNGVVKIDDSGRIEGISNVSLRKIGTDELINLNNIDLSNEIDLGEGYKADIDIIKNEQVEIGKKEFIQNSGDISCILEFDEISLEGNSNPITASIGTSEGKILFDESNENVNISIIVKKVENNVMIIVKDMQKNEVVSEVMEISDDYEQTMVVLNLQEYQLIKDVEVDVYNQINELMNLCILNREESEVNVKNKLGKIKVYHNRNNIDAIQMELYDITIKVKKDGKEIMKTEVKQNIEVKKVGE